jgi:hypothetical protein
MTRGRSECLSHAKRLRAPFHSQQNSRRDEVGFANYFFLYSYSLDLTRKVIAVLMIIALPRSLDIHLIPLAGLNLPIQTLVKKKTLVRTLSGLWAILPLSLLRGNSVVGPTY